MDLEAVKYEELSLLNKENHIFALESDSGGFSPEDSLLNVMMPTSIISAVIKVHLNLI
jgi:hypothetical protein